MGQTHPRGLGVWFPDFPGCISHAEDALTAAQGARKALGQRLQAMIENGEPVPQPTPAEAVALPDVPSYVFLGEAHPPVAKPSFVRLNVPLPEALVRRIDAVPGGNRSGWLATAANELLQRHATIPNYAASVHAARDRR